MTLLLATSVWLNAFAFAYGDPVARRVSVPSGIARIETMVLCRKGSGEIEGTSWVSSPPEVVVRAERWRRCRVLIRDAAASVYYATDEITWTGHAEPLAVTETYRVVRTSARPGPIAWVSAERQSAAECVNAGGVAECFFVRPSEAGALVESGGAGAVALFAANAPVALWQSAKWGRFVRVLGPGDEMSQARVSRLEPVFTSTRTFLRHRTSVSGITAHRVGPRFFWVSGDLPPTDAELVLSARGAGRTVSQLRTLPPSPPLAAEIFLSPETTVTGVVQSGKGVPVAATVMLSRLLPPERPTSGRRDDERPLERIEELETDAIGQFRFEQLAAGEYEVIASHPSAGRARRVVKSPAEVKLSIGSKRVRGRVTVDGVPAVNASISVLSSLEDVAASTSPLMLATDLVVTAEDGRFEMALPAEGRAMLSVLHGEAAARLDLGDVANVSAVVDVGEVRLSMPREVELLVALPATCSLQAAGPFGQPGLMILPAVPAGSGRWRVRFPLEGRWIVAGVCAERELTLDPAVVEIGPRTHLIELRVRR